MNLDVLKKQELLEIADLKTRATKVLEHLTKELQMLELKNQIQSKVKTDIDKQQREFFLNQQLKTIQEELGGQTPEREVRYHFQMPRFDLIHLEMAIEVLGILLYTPPDFL